MAHCAGWSATSLPALSLAKTCWGRALGATRTYEGGSCRPSREGGGGGACWWAEAAEEGQAQCECNAGRQTRTRAGNHRLLLLPRWRARTKHWGNPCPFGDKKGLCPSCLWTLGSSSHLPCAPPPPHQGQGDPCCGGLGPCGPRAEVSNWGLGTTSGLQMCSAACIALLSVSEIEKFQTNI